MSTETEAEAESETADRRQSHIRSLVVTATTTLGGAVAGTATFYVAEGPKDTIGLIVLAVAVALELGIIHLLGVNVEDFSTKDQLYVVFMSFSMWFVVWTILLTTAG
ncbi:MAG: hypothetical protein ABEH66_08595 [Halobacteriales archaeon]